MQPGAQVAPAVADRLGAVADPAPSNRARVIGSAAGRVSRRSASARAEAPMRSAANPPIGIAGKASNGPLAGPDNP
jgi:hypothetical protein